MWRFHCHCRYQECRKSLESRPIPIRRPTLPLEQQSQEHRKSNTFREADRGEGKRLAFQRSQTSSHVSKVVVGPLFVQAYGKPPELTLRKGEYPPVSFAKNHCRSSHQLGYVLEPM